MIRGWSIGPQKRLRVGPVQPREEMALRGTWQHSGSTYVEVIKQMEPVSSQWCTAEEQEKIDINWNEVQPKYIKKLLPHVDSSATEQVAWGVWTILVLGNLEDPTGQIPKHHTYTLTFFNFWAYFKCSLPAAGLHPRKGRESRVRDYPLRKTFVARAATDIHH